MAGVAVVLVLGMVGAVFAGTGGQQSKQNAAAKKPADEPVDPSCPPPEGTAERTIAFPGPPPNCITRSRSYRATVDTDVGTFTAELDDDKAPKTVSNFVFLARNHFYDGVPFHRVIPGFVVQGGDAEKGNGMGGPGYTIPDEFPESGPYPEGALAMANTGQPNSGGSQFFVVTGQEGMQLSPKYSLFGRVVEGLEVAKRIESDGSPEGTPKVAHKMTKVTITET